MKISIITPVFNGAQWIEGCIESVAQQTHRDFEHIIQDGGSTDGTRETVEAAAKKHPHIRFHSEKDAGIYDAMNKAMRRATGAYLYFLGCDDRIADAHVFERVHPRMRTCPAAIYGSVRIVGPGIGGVTEGGIYGGEFTAERLLRENICHQAIFYYRELVTKVGSYRTDFSLLADWDYNLRCWARGDICFEDIIIADYNTAGSSTTGVDINFMMGFYDEASRALGRSLFNSIFKGVRDRLALIGRQKLKQRRDPRGLYYLMASAWHWI